MKRTFPLSHFPTGPPAHLPTRSSAHKGFSLLEVLVTLALTAMVAVYLGARFYGAGDAVSRFDRTANKMEEIREAILGRPGYCNGVRQFSGYVADMGNRPTLYALEENGHAVSMDYDRVDTVPIFDGSFQTIVQPRGLWTKDQDADGRDDIPEEALWQYHAGDRIWAGWKGPYLLPPTEGVLRDAWGNPFIFVLGELVTLEEKDPQNPSKTIKRLFRCTRTHMSHMDALLNDYTQQPGTTDGAAFWQEIVLPGKGTVGADAWVAGGKDVYVGSLNYVLWYEDIPRNNDIHYDDALVVISYGKDGRPGGSGQDKDRLLTIYSQQYTGEVGGHAGYTGNRYTNSVTLHYPDFTEQGGRVGTKRIVIQDNDQDTGNHDNGGISFRFGTADARIRAETFDCTCFAPDAGCECILNDYVCYEVLCDIPNDHIMIWDIPSDCECLDEQEFADFPVNMCIQVRCDTEPAGSSYSCQCVDNRLECISWRCDQLPDFGEDEDCECEETNLYVSGRDPNSASLAVPIGIRSLSSTSGTLIIPVDEGRNWVGTVR